MHKRSTLIEFPKRPVDGVDRNICFEKLVNKKNCEKIKSHLKFNFWPARQFLYFYDIALFHRSHLTKKYNKHF